MPRWFDITRPIHPGMSIYPGNPDVVFEKTTEARAGKSGLTRLSLGSHTGTHIDALAHIRAGAAGIEIYDWETLVGKAQVVEVIAPETITAADLPPTQEKRVLLKTRNSNQPETFDPTFVALAEDAARELKRRGVRLVGIDGPSIKKRGVQDNVHAILLEAGIVILEGLTLKEVPAGVFELLCLPLKIHGIDGVPVRAVLRDGVSESET